MTKFEIQTGDIYTPPPNRASLYGSLLTEVRVQTKCSEVCTHNRGQDSPLQSPGGTPYDGLYGEAPPERGTFFSLQVYKRVGI